MRPKEPAMKRLLFVGAFLLISTIFCALVARAQTGAAGTGAAAPQNAPTGAAPQAAPSGDSSLFPLTPEDKSASQPPATYAPATQPGAPLGVGGRPGAAAPAPP